MAQTLALPKLGFGMTEGTLTEWLVPDGTVIAKGQPLYTLEVDKAVQEVESPWSGTLKIIAAAGNTYPVGEILAEVN